MKHKNQIIAIVAITLLPFAAAAQPAPSAKPSGKGSTIGTSLDQEVASAELIRKSSVSLKQFKLDIGRLESIMGKKMEAAERAQYLDLMVNDLLFLQYCEREKLTVTEAEQAQVVQQMKAQVMAQAQANPQAVDQATLTNWASTGSISDDSFYNLLSKMGVQSADLKTYVKKRLLLKKYMATRQKELDAMPKPGFEEVQAYYAAHQKELVRPDAVKLAILFVDLRNKDADGQRKGKELAESLFSKVRGNPTKFNEMVLRSQEANSGYVGTPEYYYAKDPEFQKLFGDAFYDAAFKLKQNEVSGLLEGPSGFHIIKAMETYAQKQLELTDPITLGEKGSVFDYIQQSLYTDAMNKKVQDMLNQLVKEIRAKSKVKIKSELLNW
jgi:hypothetical protein